jgi:ACS family hexuronate transporter-like MFS transporter
MPLTRLPGEPGPSRWWQQKRWWVAIMLLTVTMSSYVDRLALSVAAPLLKREFDFSNEQYGRITLGFLLMYGAGQLLLGPVIDRLGSKRSLSLAVVWWSVASILHAFGRGVWSFFGARAFLGMTESVNFPGAFKVVAEWFPRAERSLASGFITAGTGIGAIIAPPLIASLIHLFDHLHAIGLSPLVGWRAAFIVPGLMGFVWVWIWKRHFHPPEDHPSISDAERRLILVDRAPPATTDPANVQVGTPFGTYFGDLARHLRFRETWGLILARFSGDGAFYFFAFWIPLYLRDQRGFSMLEIAWAAALPFVFADIGSLAGGWAGQHLIRRGLSVNDSRKLMIWAGALLVPLALPAVYVGSGALAVILMGMGIFAIQVKSASLFAVPGDVFPSRDVATVWGMSGAAGSVAAALSQPVIGFIIDRTGSYEIVFMLVSSMHIVSALCVTLLIPRIEPLALARREP